MNDILTEVKFWLLVGEIQRRTIICSPDNESRIKGYIDARGLGGTFNVQVSPLVPDASIYVMDESALQATLNKWLAKPIRLWP